MSLRLKYKTGIGQSDAVEGIEEVEHHSGGGSRREQRDIGIVRYVNMSWLEFAGWQCVTEIGTRGSLLQ